MFQLDDETLMHKEVYKGYVIRIDYDMRDYTTESPVQEAPMGYMIFPVRAQRDWGGLGDEACGIHWIDTDEHSVDDYASELAESEGGIYHSEDIRAYSHSGVRLYLANGENLPVNVRCQWDSGAIGLLVITKKQAEREQFNDEPEYKMRGILDSYFSYITAWCNGEYHKYSIYDKDGGEIDDLGGYCGNDDISFAIADARSHIDRATGIQLNFELEVDNEHAEAR